MKVYWKDADDTKLSAKTTFTVIECKRSFRGGKFFGLNIEMCSFIEYRIVSEVVILPFLSLYINTCNKVVLIDFIVSFQAKEQRRRQPKQQQQQQ